MIDKVFGHYRIVAKLGEGGMGVVYRAHDEVLRRDVALKFVGEALTAEARQFSLREARAASALSHPNICTIHEVGEADGEFYIVMELIEGQPLSALIDNAGLPYESVMRYGAQIAGALTHAHGRNIVHRDLKSSNIIVTPEGLVKVLDFGLARRSTWTRRRSGQKTLDMSSITTGGTLSYMSPEVLRGATGDHRSDLWALGIVLYEAATGQVPFQGRTVFEVSSAILREPTPPLPARIPPGLAAIIQRCLAKEPALAIPARERSARLRSRLFTRPAPLRTSARSARLAPRPCIAASNISRSGTATRCCSSARSRESFCCAPRRHAGAGMSPDRIFTDRRRTRWPMTAAKGAIACGPPLSACFGAPSCAPATTTEGPGPTRRRRPFDFPADSGATLKNIWQICLGRPAEPNVLYCGVEPAALYESRDDGETWSLVRGLFDHPHRPRWMPGLGGLTLHTILLDPQDPDRMYVAISAGGVYATEDGGRTWQARNRGVRVVHMPEKYPEFGQCVHKIVNAPLAPGTALPAKPLGLVPLGQLRRELAGYRPRRAVGLRFRDGHPSAQSRTASISCPSSPTNSAALPKAACVSIARATPASPGNRSRAACPRKEPMRPSCATP